MENQSPGHSLENAPHTPKADESINEPHRSIADTPVRHALSNTFMDTGRDQDCCDENSARFRPEEEQKSSVFPLLYRHEDHPQFQYPQYLLHWWPEILACCISIIALLVLSATLYVLDGRPSPDWPKWISINTIVAIHAILIKLGIVTITTQGISQLKWSYFAQDKARSLEDLVKYDNASRGPLGALCLLWRLRFAHILSSTGAMIAILAIAMDPFAQQIIRYSDCLVHVGGLSASIPRTSVFNDQYSLNAVDDVGVGLQNAINAGVGGLSLVPPVTCPTENCTWPQQYSSVAWCSSRQDISKTLTIQEVSKNGSITYWKGGGCIQKPDFLTMEKIITSLPGEPTTTIVRERGTGIFATMRSRLCAECNNLTLSVEFVLGAGGWDGSSPTWCPIPHREKMTEERSSWLYQGYGASNCTFYPCIKTFRASVEAGELEETLVETNHQWGLWKFPADLSKVNWATVDTHCINSSEQHELLKLGYHLNKSERWLAFHGSNESELFDALARGNCLYSVNYWFAQFAYENLVNLLDGRISGASNEPVLGIEPSQDAPETVLAIYNHGHVTFQRMSDIFENISIYLTNFVRQHGAPQYSQPAIGNALQEKTCIEVQYPWLAFPAALLICAMVFLLLVVRETRPVGNKPEIWKSSPLALLYHGLPEGYGRDVDSSNADTVRDLKGMKRLAMKTKVKLSNPGDKVARFEIVNDGED